MKLNDGVDKAVSGNSIASDFPKNIDDQLSIGLLIIDKDGKITAANLQSQKWLGSRLMNLQDKRLVDFIDGDEYASIADLTPDQQNEGGQIDHWSHDVSIITKGANMQVTLYLEKLSTEFEKSHKYLVQLANNQQLFSFEIKSLVTEMNQDYIFVKDQDFRIVFANKSFLSLYPAAMRDEVIGSTTFENYHKDEMEGFLEQDKLAFSQGSSQVTEVINMPDGERRVLDTVKTKFFDAKGEPFILGVSRDVTNANELLLALEKSNQDLKQFAYVASHDLKSPANAIKQIVGWLEEDCGGSLNDEGLSHLKLLRSRSDRMMVLLDDLLEYSRFSQNKFEPDTFNLQKMVNNIMELSNPVPGFVLTVDDLTLRAPQKPFEIILRNLIFNAIKHHHGQAGKIQVKLKKESKDDCLLVLDDGPGIPAGLRSKALEMFQTLQPRDLVEGSGMGLAMVNKIVTAYRGITLLEDAQPYTGQPGLAVVMKWPKKSFINW